MSIVIDQLTIGSLLQAASCRIEANQLTLLIGRSGSGKSTLLRTIAGLIKPDAGEIRMGQAAHFEEDRWADKVPFWAERKRKQKRLLQTALAFQFPEQQLFAQTVEGEFRYSLQPYQLSKREREELTHAALKSMRLSREILAASPFELSGGQKRRVALATVLATPAPWLLLDEPSAGLDGAAVAQFKAELKDWKKQRSIVMATHDWEQFLPVADRVLLMVQGQLLELTPAELVERPDLLLQAGVGLSAAMKLTLQLKQAGFYVTASQLSPEQLAQCIVPQLQERGLEDDRHCSTDKVTDNGNDSGIGNKHDEGMTYGDHDNLSAGAGRIVYRIDARLKWLLYMLLTIVMLWQRQWGWIGISLMVAVAVLFFLRKEHIMQSLRLCKPLLWLISATAVISGLTLSISDEIRLGFSLESALTVLHNMLPFLAVTLIGFVFSLSTSTAEMKRGLEQGLSLFHRLGIQTSMIALGASLVLRFIPMIIAETERFSLITAARGKRVIRKGQIRMRDIHVFAIPLLISLFQMVEDLITALEIKNHKQKK